MGRQSRGELIILSYRRIREERRDTLQYATHHAVHDNIYLKLYDTSTASVPQKLCLAAQRVWLTESVACASGVLATCSAASSVSHRLVGPCDPCLEIVSAGASA